MAQISTVALPAYTIPKPVVHGAPRTITTRFSPTELSANVTSGDNILLATLGKLDQVVGGSVRIIGIAGASLCFVQARITENSVSYNITNPVSATVSGSIGFIAPAPVDSRYVKTWELVVGGGSIDSTATGIVECTIHLDNYQEAG